MSRVLVCHQPTDGGVGRHVRDTANGLAARGWEVTLCSPAPPEGIEGTVKHVPLDLARAIAPGSDLSACARLARTVGELKVDVVHAHSSKAGAVARLARLAHPGIPVVYTPHGYAFAGYFTRPSERSAYRLVERLLSPLASRVVCVCEAEAALARSVGPGARVRVVFNGVDSAPAGPPDPQLAELAREGPLIGALTMLRPGKGLETLIDATPALLARHRSAQVAIVGDGPDLDVLQARAQQREVAHAVHFVGSRSDPLAALRTIDVLAHPSWAESFPYVVLEAMSLGKPVLASDVGGIGEELENGISGLLVPPGDHELLSRALNDLLDDPSRRSRIGEMARERVSAKFSIQGMIDRLGGVYDELVRSSQGTTSVGRTHSQASPSALSQTISGTSPR